jgi:transcriptional regulator with XRE-family HTH domain
MATVLADRLLLSRRDVDITQEDLAEQAGNVSAAYISSLERGKVTNPTVEVIAALAAALGVSPAYLLGWSDIPLPGEANAIGEERVAYRVDLRIQELIDLYEDLDPANQVIALEILNTLRRAQNVRTVGGES